MVVVDKDPRNPERIAQLCCSEASVSVEYAKNPNQSPGEIAEELFGSHVRVSSLFPFFLIIVVLLILVAAFRFFLYV